MMLIFWRFRHVWCVPAAAAVIRSPIAHAYTGCELDEICGSFLRGGSQASARPMPAFHPDLGI